MINAETLKQTAARLGLSELAMAAYMGVPVHTYSKWENGTRGMDAAPRRLLDVLERIENEAPDLHLSLIEAAQAAGGPQEARGRRKGAPKAEKPASAAPDAPAMPDPAPLAPVAPPPPWAHAAEALPSWMNPTP
jgi:transcriptional regulator with XRE-family HTH domain